MNIKGLIALIELGLPVMRNTMVFRNPKEIPKKFLEAYGDEERWAVRGFDDRFTIKDPPYNCGGSFGYFPFKKEDFLSAFNKMDNKLEQSGVPNEHRIFIVCEIFYSEEVDFAGHAILNQDVILIDIKKGNKPSGKDWTPEWSFQIEVKGRGLNLSEVDAKWKELISKIGKDILNFPDKTCLEFVKLKDGQFFYHDLYVHG